MARRLQRLRYHSRRHNDDPHRHDHHPQHERLRDLRHDGARRPLLHHAGIRIHGPLHQGQVRCERGRHAHLLHRHDLLYTGRDLGCSLGIFKIEN